SGLDALLSEFVGQILVLLAQTVSMWGVIVGDLDGIVLDADIAFQSAEKFSGYVRGIPLRKGFAQSLTHLVNSGLGHQGHGHLSVTDVEVERTGPMPTQGLVE